MDILQSICGYIIENFEPHGTLLQSVAETTLGDLTELIALLL
jgi:hypothetical protein